MYLHLFFVDMNGKKWKAANQCETQFVSLVEFLFASLVEFLFASLVEFEFLFC